MIFLEHVGTAVVFLYISDIKHVLVAQIRNHPVPIAPKTGRIEVVVKSGETMMESSRDATDDARGPKSMCNQEHDREALLFWEEHPPRHGDKSLQTILANRSDRTKNCQKNAPRASEVYREIA